jgi:hypothetical protein
MTPEHVAFITEQIDPDFDGAGGDWLAARFDAMVREHPPPPDEELPDFFEGSFDEALAWAATQTDAIVVRVADRRHAYSAGARLLPGLRRWPPADLAPLVRRRPPDRDDDHEQHALFAAFAAAHQPEPGDDPLLSALDALLLTEAVPDPRQLRAFVERHGVELGDNHFSTARTQWLPVLDEGDDRSLLLEVDESGLVESARIVRVDEHRAVG